jgi:hypothetical protein
MDGDMQRRDRGFLVNQRANECRQESALNKFALRKFGPSTLRTRRAGQTAKTPNGNRVHFEHQRGSCAGEAQGEVVEKPVNARQNADSKRVREKETRVRRRKSAILLSKSADSTGSRTVASSAAEPGAELDNDGQIGAALGGLLARANERDSKGRFTRDNAAHLRTLEHSGQLRAALAPLKQELVERVRVQLGADTDDAPETLLGVIDAYAEARLLRSSAFVRLSQLGGFMTSKGKARALLSTWGAAFDREMRAAERLGLVRRARRAQTPIEWLRSLGDETQQGGPDDEQEPERDDASGRPTQPAE